MKFRMPWSSRGRPAEPGFTYTARVRLTRAYCDALLARGGHPPLSKREWRITDASPGVRTALDRVYARRKLPAIDPPNPPGRVGRLVRRIWTGCTAFWRRLLGR